MFDVVLVGSETTCERPSLSEMESKAGCWLSLRRSMLKSPMSSSDLVQDGGSSSSVASRVTRSDKEVEGGR